MTKITKIIKERIIEKIKMEEVKKDCLNDGYVFKPRSSDSLKRKNSELHF
jgi:hypothetical protein